LKLCVCRHFNFNAFNYRPSNPLTMDDVFFLN